MLRVRSRVTLLIIALFMLSLSGMNAYAADYSLISNRIVIYNQNAYGGTTFSASNLDLSIAGCGFFTVAHALQYMRISSWDGLDDFVVKTKGCISPTVSGSGFIDQVKSIYGGFSHYQYSPTSDSEAFYQKLDSTFKVGGCGTVSIRKPGGHYILFTSFSSDKSKIHVLDSSAGTTLKHLASLNRNAYYYDTTSNSFKVVTDITQVPGTYNKDKNPTDNYGIGREYWVDKDYIYAQCRQWGEGLHVMVPDVSLENPDDDIYLYSEKSIYKATKATSVKTQPYAKSEEHPDSETLITLAKGDEVTVVEAYKNSYKNQWYKINAVNGNTAYNGYVYSGDFTYVRSDAEAYIENNSMYNANIKAGNGYEITGRLKSTNAITKIDAYVYMADMVGPPYPVKTVSFGSDTYIFDLGPSVINTGIKLASYTTTGNYIFRLDVHCKTNGGSDEITIPIYTPFVISSNGSGSSVNYLDPVVFNLDYYLEANPDVKAMNWSADVVRKHWLQNGISEGRVASPAFDVGYYVEQNTDLQSFRGNNAGAIEHYCTFGVYESRPTSSIFNIAQYKTNYPDLAEAYAYNDYEIARHFVEAGYREGRIANRSLMVYFDGNGGSVTTGSKVIQKSRKYGTLPTPTRSGYSFDGWYTAASGGTRVTEDTVHTLLQELTLYAHWSKRMVTGISLSSTAISLNVGDAQTLSATVVPSDAYDGSVTWSTSNPAVATVSSGRITAVGAGAATITCSATDGSSKSASCTVTVNPNKYELDVNGHLDDGSVLGGCNGFGTFDVYIDGVLCGNDVSDYVNREMRSGMTYEIRDVNALPGYRYNGLCTSASLGGLSGTIANGNAYIVLDFATVYPVTYDANGGSGAPTAQEKVRNAALTLSMTRPVRSGYTFLGWATEPDAVSAQYQPGASYTDNADCTLYAVWKKDAIEVAQIALSETGLTLEVGEMRLLTAAVSPENASNPAVVWSTSDDSVATVNNGTVTALRTGTATVTCSASDGGGASAACAVTVREAHVHMLVMDRPVLATQSASGLSAGMHCRICNAVALPQREVGRDRILSLPGALKTVGEEAFAGADMQQVVIPDGTTQIEARAFADCRELLLVFIPDSVKTIADNAFAGCDPEALCIVVESGDSYAAVYANARGLKLCESVESITIVLNANGGLCPETSRVINCGDAIGALPTPMREEYDFTGWYTAATGGTRVTLDTVFDQPATLYAQWEWCVGFVSFDANGGSCTESYRKIYRGKPVGTLLVPTRENYSFEGWYTALTGGAKVTAETAFDVQAPRLYAHWTRNTCAICFNANGGACAEASRVINCGDPIGALPASTREYHRFNGWFTAASGGEQVSAATRFAAPTTLYAQWTENDWSDWVTEASVPGGARIVDTKTQYRYRDTTYSTVYSPWSAWSDWTTTRQSTSDLKKEETATVYGWYWFQCPNCGAHWHVWSGLAIDCSPTWGPGGGCGNDNIQSTDGHIVWDTTPWSSGTANWCGTGRICLGSDIKTRMFAWQDGGSAREGYRYATRTSSQQANVGTWSAWSDAAVSASGTREVETRRLVRYQVK